MHPFLQVQYKLQQTYPLVVSASYSLKPDVVHTSSFYGKIQNFKTFCIHHIYLDNVNMQFAMINCRSTQRTHSSRSTQRNHCSRSTQHNHSSRSTQRNHSSRSTQCNHSSRHVLLQCAMICRGCIMFSIDLSN